MVCMQSTIQNKVTEHLAGSYSVKLSAHCMHRTALFSSAVTYPTCCADCWLPNVNFRILFFFNPHCFSIRSLFVLLLKLRINPRCRSKKRRFHHAAIFHVWKGKLRLLRHPNLFQTSASNIVPHDHLPATLYCQSVQKGGLVLKG